ncbi:MAG: hypothetical protein JO301_01995 [Chitinophagaceae bacterium]|nr:hypothetical protein [Chitinophagaceae bacterium]
MKLILTLSALLALSCGFAQNGASVSIIDFKVAEGKLTGWLRYLDYSSNKPFSMPAEVELRVSGPDKIVLAISYPKEPKANGNDILTITGNGTVLNGAPLVERSMTEDGAIKLVTETSGEDGNQHRKALIRHIYFVGRNIFQNRKEVKFEGEDKWIMRNEFLFIR